MSGCASAQPASLPASAAPATLPAAAAPAEIPIMTDSEALKIGKAYAERQAIMEHQRVLQLEQALATRDLAAKHDQLNGLISESADRLKLKQADGWRPDWENRVWRKETSKP
jgi:hypothetical protein